MSRECFCLCLKLQLFVGRKKWFEYVPKISTRPFLFSHLNYCLFEVVTIRLNILLSLSLSHSHTYFLLPLDHTNPLSLFHTLTQPLLKLSSWRKDRFPVSRTLPLHLASPSLSLSFTPSLCLLLCYFPLSFTLHFLLAYVLFTKYLCICYSSISLYH